MRSFSQVVVFLFALLAVAFAQQSISYDATVYVTSTVYKVNTVTMSGYPTASVANSTSTIHPTGTPVYPGGNSTAAYPTGTGATGVPSPSEFPGAASQMSINSAIVAALAAAVGYLAL